MKHVASPDLDIEGLIVPPQSLRLRRAQHLVAALSADDLPYATLVECRTGEGSETVVFDVEMERPQICDYDIRGTERLAATFDPSDGTYPEVVALRHDFPIVPHLYLRNEELPRSLCLYDRPWAEIRLTWTAPSFIEWIRTWLALTARDELHQEDQALEPLVLSCGWHLLLPANLDLEADEGPIVLAVEVLGGKDGRVLQGMPVALPEWHKSKLAFAALYTRTPPRRHGVIRRTPQTVKDLCELARTEDFDLLDTLRRQFKQLPDEKPIDAPVVLIVGFPKTRTDGGAVESTEVKAFLTSMPLKGFGVGIGVWHLFNGQVSQLLEVEETHDGSEIKIDAINVSRMLSWSMAARLNGQENRDNRAVVAVGAGALGSQVLMNLARSGWGQWTIIDNDVLFPHNLARHGLLGPWVGSRKSEITALSINTLAQDKPIAAPIVCDVLHPGDRTEEVDRALRDAQIVLDMSASIPVARYLASREIDARIVSLFMSPTGRDLVLLAEDAGRCVRLDHVEMLYYNALASEEQLLGHFNTGDGQVRYGTSCRDVSSRIPQEWVAIQAGIAAAEIRRAAVVPEPTARVWRINPDTNAVAAVEIAVEPFVRQRQGDWEVLVTPTLFRTVVRWRTDRLPRETGGILIGAVDHDRKVVYLTKALPSPPDSEEWPTMYVRGAKGLSAERDRIREQTAGHLDYIGEWHSHPAGTGTMPSADDRKVCGWVGQHLFMEGRPAVMLICGNHDETRVFVERLDHEIPEPLWPQ